MSPQQLQRQAAALAYGRDETFFTNNGSQREVSGYAQAKKERMPTLPRPEPGFHQRAEPKPRAAIQGCGSRRLPASPAALILRVCRRLRRIQGSAIYER